MRTSDLVNAGLAILVAALMGCAGASAETESTERPLEPAEPASRWLIWGTFKGELSTYEIEVRGETTKIVDEYPGARIATSRGVWQWAVEDTTVVEADCACFMEKFHEVGEVEEGECQVETTQKRGAFYEIGGDRSWAPEVLGDGETDSEYSPSFDVTGSLGSRAFVTTCVYLYSCGAAHPSTVCESTVVDLETLETWEPAELVEPISDPSELVFEGENSDPGRNGIELVELAVRATPEGAKLRHRYITPTCYVCSDGEWSSYSTSAQIDSMPVEGPLEADAQLEPALQPVLDEIGRANVRGWSRTRPLDH